MDAEIVHQNLKEPSVGNFSDLGGNVKNKLLRLFKAIERKSISAFLFMFKQNMSLTDEEYKDWMVNYNVGFSYIWYFKILIKRLLSKSDNVEFIKNKCIWGDNKSDIKK